MFPKLTTLPLPKYVTAAFITGSLSLGLMGCAGEGASSFSILGAEKVFKQSAAFAPRKVDILWVIDNSGSMKSSQDNLAANFPSFIQGFQQKDYDFHMAITTSDAYLSYHTGDLNRSKFKGSIMDKNTANLSTVFSNTVKVGVAGSGDERAFMSSKAFLENSLNNNFLRPGSFLAIIIVSDEEDFSKDDYQNGMSSYSATENVNHPDLYTNTYMKNFLDLKTNSSLTIKNYSVSTISILDTACYNVLKGNGQKIGNRYKSLATATNGYLGSLCADFSQVLSGISDKVLADSAEFVLDSEPVVASISVVVGGVVVPQDASNGWTYHPERNSVQLHGSAVPAVGTDVRISFDPKGVKI